MLNGHEFTAPIQYGYLLLAGIIILTGCIAGIIYIIRQIRETATNAPDYHAYWKIDQRRYSITIPPPEIKDGIPAYSSSEVNITWIRPSPMSAKSNGGPCSGSEKRKASNIYKTLIRQPFQWKTFLDDAIAGRLTTWQIERAKTLSAHFQTCPCGQLDPDIPRREGEQGEPEDKELARLGAEFWQALYMDDYLRARDIYHQIKFRELLLLHLPQSKST